jgi:tricorn protease
MNILSRAFALGCLIAASLVSITAVSAQDLSDTTRLLRFPTTNETQIVFCYAGELYTVGKDGGTARRLTSGPGYTSFARFSPDGTQIAFTSHYDGNGSYVCRRGGTPNA